MRASQLAFRSLHDAIAAALPAEAPCCCSTCCSTATPTFATTPSRAPTRTRCCSPSSARCTSRGRSGRTRCTCSSSSCSAPRTVRTAQFGRNPGAIRRNSWRNSGACVFRGPSSSTTRFIASAHAARIKSVPWFRERILQQISPGSLLIVGLTRTVLANLGGAQDAYVHTNCLAALANMAPSVRHIHPHAARCLISLVDALSRRLQRLEVAAAGGGGILATALAHESAALAAAAAAADEAQTHADFLRTALEVICLTLAAALPPQRPPRVRAARARARLRAPPRRRPLRRPRRQRRPRDRPLRRRPRRRPHDRARDAVGGGRRAVGDPDGGDGVVGRQGARPHPRGGGELERGEARGADRFEVHVRAGGEPRGVLHAVPLGRRLRPVGDRVGRPRA